MSALVGCFLVFATGLVQKTTSPFEVLALTPEKAVVKIDPKAYDIKLFKNKHHRSADFVINTNFFWKDKPIGIIKDFDFIPSITKYNFDRPVFLIDLAKNPSIGIVPNMDYLYEYTLASQAGPWLVRDGKIVYPTSMVEGFLKSDVARKTRHTCIGVTATNKIILYYHNSINLLYLAQDIIKYGCISAMNLDGGSSSALKVGKKMFGNPAPKYGLEFIR